MSADFPEGEISSHRIGVWERWQGKPKRRAFPWCALDAYLTLMVGDEHLADIEAQTKSFARAAQHGHSLDLMKPLPDLFLRFFGESWPSIAYPDTGRVLLERQADLDRLIGR